MVDLTNPKRFTFGKSLYLNPRDNVTVLNPRRIDPVGKGDMYLRFSLPYLNSFYLKPALQPTKYNTGFWGFSAGLEYYYTDRRYLTLSASAVTDLFVPVPAPVDRSGPVQSMNSIYVSLTDNHRLNRWHIGYGLVFARNIWTLDYDRSVIPPSVVNYHLNQSSNAAGVGLSVYRQMTNHFFHWSHLSSDAFEN